MPDVVTVACDVCLVQKKDTNHWWMLWIETWHKKGPVLCMREFDAEFWSGIAEKRAVACGEEHLHELVSRYTITRTFDPPSSRPVSLSPTREEPNQ